MIPKNQHQLVLWYLIYWRPVSLKDVINHSMFFKFQTRLSEIETKHGILTKKERRKFTNRFRTKSSYMVYTCIDKQKAKELFKKY